MLKLQKTAVKPRVRQEEEARYDVDREYDSRLELLEIDMIRPNPYQPRKIFTEASLEELKQSMLAYGQITPITVRRTSSGRYELIAGERRWRAAKRAGFTHIKAIVQNAAETDSAMIALIENLQRENLHFFEEAEAFLALMRDHGLTQEELAARLSKNQSTIANKLRLLKLPKKVKEMILAGKLTERHSRALLRLHNEEMQIKLVREICEKGLSVKLTEELVEETLRRMYGEMPAEDGRKVIFLTRDCKLFANSIRRTVDKLRATGAHIDYDAKEDDEGIVIRIAIKRATKQRVVQG